MGCITGNEKIPPLSLAVFFRLRQGGSGKKTLNVRKETICWQVFVFHHTNEKHWEKPDLKT
jgi:hypothetical protein